MTLIEVCFLILTSAVVASAVALLAIVVRLGTTLRLMEELTVETRESVHRMDSVGRELQRLLQRANQDYSQAREVAGRVIDDVVVPMRTAQALFRGLRAGARALFRAPAGSRTSLPRS